MPGTDPTPDRRGVEAWSPAGVWDALTDLVLPAGCAGCRAPRVPLRMGVCGDCAAILGALRPTVARPDPAPPDLPECVALGAYQGVLRETLLAYKERGRHGLARPLGSLLAEVIAEVVSATGEVSRAQVSGKSLAVGTGGEGRTVLLVPVPATARAVRARHGDHLRRLTRHAADRLRRAGWPVTVARPLRALPRPDSAGLDSAGRATAAFDAFRLREGRMAGLLRAAAGCPVVVVDDIVTTGVTLAAVTRLLTSAGVPITGAAVLAATIKRAHR